jgi:hypothetical protein
MNASVSVELFVLDTTYIFSNKEKLEDFAVIDEVVLKSKSDKSLIVEALSNKDHFITQRVVNNCVFIPDLGIRFRNNEEVLIDVLISSYCSKCKLIYNDTVFIFSSKEHINDVLKIASKNLN